jgi:hypothetical protein
MNLIGTIFFKSFLELLLILSIIYLFIVIPRWLEQRLKQNDIYQDVD